MICVLNSKEKYQIIAFLILLVYSQNSIGIRVGNSNFRTSITCLKNTSSFIALYLYVLLLFQSTSAFTLLAGDASPSLNRLVFIHYQHTQWRCKSTRSLHFFLWLYVLNEHSGWQNLSLCLIRVPHA